MTGGPRSKRRATRFALNLPLRFRVRGEIGWSYGMTENISGSGALVRTGRAADLATPVELEVVLPGTDQGGARVIGHGSVTRAPGSIGGDHAIAMSIDGYELIRTAKNDTDDRITKE